MLIANRIYALIASAALHLFAYYHILCILLGHRWIPTNADIGRKRDPIVLCSLNPLPKQFMSVCAFSQPFAKWRERMAHSPKGIKVKVKYYWLHSECTPSGRLTGWGIACTDWCSSTDITNAMAIYTNLHNCSTYLSSLHCTVFGFVGMIDFKRRRS